MDGDARVAEAMALIERRSTLVLATAGAGAWAAPVYYVYDRGRFWFFSSPRSRHIAEGLAAGGCAASVFEESGDWRLIEGLQMEGSLVGPAGGPEAPGVVGLYVRKFPTSAQLLGIANPDAGAFRDRLRAELYAFAPSRVYYLNNRAGLGRRSEIRLLD